MSACVGAPEEDSKSHDDILIEVLKVHRVADILRFEHVHMYLSSVSLDFNN